MISPVYENIPAIKLTLAKRSLLAANIKRYGRKWNNKKFDWFKQDLHAWLRLKQHDRCCYCRRILLFGKGPVEIEHIVSKGATRGYPKFTFEVQNLALSCKDCNNGKLEKPVLLVRLNRGAAYPTSVTQYRWVHPYLHRYSDHITIHDCWVYEARGGSLDGQTVIDNCKLNLLRSIEVRNREAKVRGEPDLAGALARAASYASEVGKDQLCRDLAPTVAGFLNPPGSSAIGEALLRKTLDAIKAIADAAQP